MNSRLRDFLIVLAGTASTIAAIYLLMSLIVSEQWIESNSLIIFTHGLYLLLLPPLLWAVRYRPSSDNGFVPPRVRLILENGSIITEPCEWLGYRTTVSVFKMQEDVEMYVFEAYVSNIQANKLVQLAPIEKSFEPEAINTLKSIKAHLLIKPGHIHEP